MTKEPQKTARNVCAELSSWISISKSNKRAYFVCTKAARHSHAQLHPPLPYCSAYRWRYQQSFLWASHDSAAPEQSGNMFWLDVLGRGESMSHTNRATRFLRKCNEVWSSSLWYRVPQLWRWRPLITRRGGSTENPSSFSFFPKRVAIEWMRDMASSISSSLAYPNLPTCSPPAILLSQREEARRGCKSSSRLANSSFRSFLHSSSSAFKMAICTSLRVPIRNFSCNFSSHAARIPILLRDHLHLRWMIRAAQFSSSNCVIEHKYFSSSEPSTSAVTSFARNAIGGHHGQFCHRAPSEWPKAAAQRPWNTPGKS